MSDSNKNHKGGFNGIPIPMGVLSPMSPVSGDFQKVVSTLPKLPPLPVQTLRGLHPFGMMSGMNGMPLNPRPGMDIGMAVSYPNGPTVFHNSAIQRVMTGDQNIPVMTETESKPQVQQPSTTVPLVPVIEKEGALLIFLEEHNGKDLVVLSKKGEEYCLLGNSDMKGNPNTNIVSSVKELSSIDLSKVELEKVYNGAKLYEDIVLNGKNIRLFCLSAPKQDIRGTVSRKFMLDDILKLSELNNTIKAANGSEFKICKNVLTILNENNNLIQRAKQHTLKQSTPHMPGMMGMMGIPNVMGMPNVSVLPPGMSQPVPPSFPPAPGMMREVPAPQLPSMGMPMGMQMNGPIIGGPTGTVVAGPHMGGPMIHSPMMGMPNIPLDPSVGRIPGHPMFNKPF